MMLLVENLCKNFGKVEAVQNATFKVSRGEVVGLLGPNGAGKTTTMRLITGYLKPDQGNITLGGVSVLENPREVQRQIGYLPENAPSYHDMEVTAFLTYAALLRQVSKKDIPSHLKEAIELCGLGDVVGRQIGQLSRGYKQRVCLAQAMIHKPPLLILDEPTTGLDPHQIHEIRAVIKAIGQERTVILSTHIMQEVQAVCNRALIIARGKVVGAGTLDELMKQASGVSRYFVKIKASRSDIEQKAFDLLKVVIEGWGKESNGVWQSVILKSDEQEDHSEEIFNWVLQNKWSLKELKRENTSLEDVFLELTKQ
ncbi:MAG: ATP-binding cassette domain-containing protein [Deltaproteobacteria bacterium]|nr:ATP-binding cassette domain-containing protein [Deltaproteobacteria bacterium]